MRNCVKPRRRGDLTAFLHVYRGEAFGRVGSSHRGGKVKKALFVAAFAAAAACMAAASASAQNLPPYAQPAPAGQATSPYEINGKFISGRVRWFQPYNLQLNHGPHIYLHDGTVILPTGLDLQPGMPVYVWGHLDASGRYNADSIALAPPPPPRARRAEAAPAPEPYPTFPP